MEAGQGRGQVTPRGYTGLGHPRGGPGDWDLEGVVFDMPDPLSYVYSQAIRFGPGGARKARSM